MNNRFANQPMSLPDLYRKTESIWYTLRMYYQYMKSVSFHSSFAPFRNNVEKPCFVYVATMYPKENLKNQRLTIQYHDKQGPCFYLGEYIFRETENSREINKKAVCFMRFGCYGICSDDPIIERFNFDLEQKIRTINKLVERIAFYEHKIQNAIYLKRFVDQLSNYE